MLREGNEGAWKVSAAVYFRPSFRGWVFFYIVPLLSGSFWHSCFRGVLRLITSPVKEGGHYF